MQCEMSEMGSPGGSWANSPGHTILTAIVVPQMSRTGPTARDVPEDMGMDPLCQLRVELLKGKEWGFNRV